MPAPKTAARGTLKHVCRLGEGVWAVLGTMDKPPGPARGHRRSPLQAPGATAIVFAFERDESNPDRIGFLALCRGEDLTGGRRLDFGPVSVHPEAANGPRAQIEPAELAVRLGVLDGGTRRLCMCRLSEATELCDPGTRGPVAKTLYMLREAMRDPLPRSPLDQKPDRALQIDALFAIDERSFYVRGWMHDAESPITGLTAISPEGLHSDLTGRLFRYDRPDVAAHYGLTETTTPLGFLGYFELAAASALTDGWIFTASNAQGHCIEAAAPPLEDQPQRSRTAILADLVHDRGGDRLLPQHTFPAVSRLQEATAARVSIDRIDHFGTPPKDPEVSVVVPLYRRIDFVEHQMAHFFHDIQIRSAEIIYVLDSPELTTDLDRMSRQLWALYGVPFTVVTLDRNGGFSAANNLGASAASGRKLLFMNSDVLPERPGWLAEMSSFYDSTDCIGALGPKLVYEDATLQHAGLEFRWSDENRCWLNVHCYQGLHRDFPPAQVPREVPGVTGACLMIDAALYRRVGGMRGMYMQGDFEDSDLCLRLRGMGLANWYLPAVSLFHLEGQSYPSEMRRLAFRYNSWVHTVLWGDRISQIMQSQAEAFPRVSEVFAQSTEVTT